MATPRETVPYALETTVPTIGWRMWVPTLALGLCSGLAFVDRQILAVLSPVILRDTGLTAQSYAEVVSIFSIAYMIANPLWGSLMDFIGLRIGMTIAVAVWSVASTSHAWMAGFVGFAAARAVLALGEGAIGAGGLRAAVDSLPSDKQARGIATSYSGGAIGAILTPLIIVPIALRVGWRSAFFFTGALGVLWLIVWGFASRPPYLLKRSHRPEKIAWPNLLERRCWALISIYALGAFSIGPVLYLVPLYLNRALGMSQGQLGKVLWAPPLGWALGYFFWGWAADRFATTRQRTVNTVLLLALLSLPIVAIPLINSGIFAVFLFSWAAFIAGGFQMVGLRDGARAYSRERASMAAGIASGSWSALVALLLPTLGRWFDQHRYNTIFWFIALVPWAGTLFWLWLSRTRATRAV